MINMKCQLCKQEKPDVKKYKIKGEEDSTFYFCDSCLVESSYLTFKSLIELSRMAESNELTDEQRKNLEMQIKMIDSAYSSGAFKYTVESDEYE